MDIDRVDDEEEVPHSVNYVTIVITAQCPNGSIHVETAGTCLLLTYSKQTWDGARVSILLEYFQIVKCPTHTSIVSYANLISVCARQVDDGVASGEIKCFNFIARP